MTRKRWTQAARQLKESGLGTGARITGETGPGAWTYAVAVGAVLLALALTSYAQSLVEGNLMLLCLVAVTVSAWYGGTGPGLVATLLAIVGTDYLFHPAISTDSGGFAILTERLRPGLFAGVSILISALSGARKSAENDLDRTLATLEQRVHERTEELSAANVALQAQVAGRIKAEESYRELFENASDTIFTLDLQGRFTSLNKAGEQLTGYSTTEALGIDFVGIVSPKDEDVARTMLADLLEGSTPKAGRLNLVAKAGQAIPVETSVRLILRDERPYGVQGIVRDLTERDRLEAELRQSQKLEGVGRLAGGVAHDFNNLLMIIQGYTDMALSQLDKEAPLRTDLTEISKAAERGGSLTRQLLAFSRKQVLRVAPLELNRLVEDTANILGLLLGDRIHLDLKLSHEPCPIEADRSQLEHVLITLATNARDAMSGAGTLRIEVAAVEPPEPIQVAKDSRYIRVRMHDTGCGMDQETMAQVFDPFFTTKTLGSGTGLGLATAYGTVKQLGGHIEVDSAPLQGTTFTVYFPRTDKPIVLPTEGPVQESAGGSETVLLVEDDAAVRRISRTALQRYGYEVLEADGPRAALKLATSHAERIDLVLTDVMMPEMTGPEMVALLKSICPTARVLFISGYANDTLVRDGVLPADVDLVQKPIATRELLAAVRHVLGMRASAPSPGMATLSVH